MKLKHYTSDLKSAKSIIDSKELWLRKTGMTKDSNEIFHYFDIFNTLNTIEDISRILKTNTPSNPKNSLYENYIASIYLTYFYQTNKLQLGQVLADVIRDESYIACFTEESDNKSGYHEDSYGPIAFVFKENPLRVKENKDFVFVQAKIHYINKKDFDILLEVVNELFNDSIMRYIEPSKFEDINSELFQLVDIISKSCNKNEQKKRRKGLNRSFEGLETKSISSRERLGSILKDLAFDLKGELELASYINQRVNDIREKKISDYYPQEIAGAMKKTGMFRHNKTPEHTWNLIACFVKDIQFSDDEETRIIALPRNKNVNRDNLKVDMDMELIEKITVSTKIGNRELVVQELKDYLDSKGLSRIRVL